MESLPAQYPIKASPRLDNASRRMCLKADNAALPVSRSGYKLPPLASRKWPQCSFSVSHDFAIQGVLFRLRGLLDNADGSEAFSYCNCTNRLFPAREAATKSAWSLPCAPFAGSRAARSKLATGPAFFEGIFLRPARSWPASSSASVEIMVFRH